MNRRVLRKADHGTVSPPARMRRFRRPAAACMPRIGGHEQQAHQEERHGGQKEEDDPAGERVVKQIGEEEEDYAQCFVEEDGYDSAAADRLDEQEEKSKSAQERGSRLGQAVDPEPQEDLVIRQRGYTPVPEEVNVDEDVQERGEEHPRGEEGGGGEQLSREHPLPGGFNPGWFGSSDKAPDSIGRFNQ